MWMIRLLVPMTIQPLSQSMMDKVFILWFLARITTMPHPEKCYTWSTKQPDGRKQGRCPFGLCHSSHLLETVISQHSVVGDWWAYQDIYESHQVAHDKISARCILQTLSFKLNCHTIQGYKIQEKVQTLAWIRFMTTSQHNLIYPTR